jgi:hypothetical protein
MEQIFLVRTTILDSSLALVGVAASISFILGDSDFGLWVALVATIALMSRQIFAFMSQANRKRPLSLRFPLMKTGIRST